MGASCCDHDTCHAPDPQRGNETYRRILWAVLVINAAMFAVEIGAGLAAGSASLQADALDFLGDAANYAISLFVVGMTLRYRAMAALAKGMTMAAFGLWVIGITAWHAIHGTLPHAFELCPNVGDGRGQAAAAWGSRRTTSMPLVKVTPRITFGKW
jgi:Co/Zn/Cd efflux system component